MWRGEERVLSCFMPGDMRCYTETICRYLFLTIEKKRLPYGRDEIFV
jgi:hypothetical protein